MRRLQGRLTERIRSAAGTALALVLAAACTGLIPPPEPHPPGCGDGAESRNSASAPEVRVEPKYPPSALRRRTSGYVCMNFTVQRDGSVGDICVSDQYPGTLFDREAVAALAQWKFAPGAEPYPSGNCMQFYVE